MNDTTAAVPGSLMTLEVDNVQSDFSMTDDEINAAAYIEDDDSDYNLNIGGLSITAPAVVMLVVLLSGCIGALFFLCCHLWDRRREIIGKDLWSDSDSDDEEEEEDEPYFVEPRTTAQIERGLKLKQWEQVKDDISMDDDPTESHHSSSSDEEEEEEEEEIVSVVSDVSSTTCTTCSKMSTLMKDPAFVRLQQRPRCVLCSKFFTDADTVTESWDPHCKHHFHKECIVKWLKTHDGCPICKKAYVVGLKVELP